MFLLFILVNSVEEILICGEGPIFIGGDKLKLICVCANLSHLGANLVAEVTSVFKRVVIRIFRKLFKLNG